MELWGEAFLAVVIDGGEHPPERPISKPGLTEFRRKRRLSMYLYDRIIVADPSTVMFSDNEICTVEL